MLNVLLCSFPPENVVTAHTFSPSSRQSPLCLTVMVTQEPQSAFVLCLVSTSLLFTEYSHVPVPSRKNWKSWTCTLVGRLVTMPAPIFPLFPSGVPGGRQHWISFPPRHHPRTYCRPLSHVCLFTS